MNRLLVPILFVLVSVSLSAAENADLVFRLVPGQIAKYQWNTTGSTESGGREMGKPFILKSESTTEMTVSFKALPKRADIPGQPLLIKIENYSYRDKKSVGDDIGEVIAGKGKVKATQNGKAIVDSENDISLDDVKSFQQAIKKIETGEMRISLDGAGKFLGDPTGDGQVIELIKASGAESLPRILAGRTVTLGEQWADSQSINYIASFKLAKPTSVRSTATFKGWEEKNGKKLARFDIDAIWDTANLNGENEEGLLVEVTRVQGASAGTCYFDPATGQYAEGRFDVLSKYRIDGKKDGQSTGLDVSGKMSFSFKLLSIE